MESGFQFKNPSLTKLEFIVNNDFSSEGKKSVQIQINMSVDITRDQNLNEATVALKVEIGDKGDVGPYYINVVEEARFRWGEEFSDEQVEKLLNQNAPSLLLSYVRPIVAQTTASSLYGAYNIPFMNFTQKKK